ncbi:unnamed protein product [Pocillopora meandrina]|uniref:Uncharacterized protein n=1 Tax=Pocillopora meandrina TaxID=46732 RepID=A0AAU9WS45_9CNID|nr:unnamed protein product [Pocillopora meandrina]
MNTWLMIKEEASGWPSHVGNNPLKRQRHLDDYRDKEGIELDPEKIEKNPGLHTLAKMIIQSDDRVEVQYTLQEEDESISPNLNIFVACFTTC